MQICLKRPTDEACQAFELILTNPHYYWDASEDEDVCYTVFEESEATIKQWIAQAREKGIADAFRVEPIDESEDNKETPTYA